MVRLELHPAEPGGPRMLEREVQQLPPHPAAAERRFEVHLAELAAATLFGVGPHAAGSHDPAARALHDPELASTPAVRFVDLVEVAIGPFGIEHQAELAQDPLDQGPD